MQFVYIIFVVNIVRHTLGSSHHCIVPLWPIRKAHLSVYDYFITMHVKGLYLEVGTNRSNIIGH